MAHKERAASHFTDSFPMYRLGSSTLSEEINSSNSVSSMLREPQCIPITPTKGSVGEARCILTI